jgi:hypothetical protein
MERRTCLRSNRVKGLRQLKTSQWLAWESGWRGMTRQLGARKVNRNTQPSRGVWEGGRQDVRFFGANER